MIRDQKAFDKARSRERQELDEKVAVAAKNLPIIIATKHNGRLNAGSQSELYFKLIRDGVLGGEWMARHIAHAVKYNKPLPQHQQAMAGIIIDGALQRVYEEGHILPPSNKKSTFDLRLPETNEDQQDPDERYPVSQVLPRYRAIDWNLQSAHE